MYRRVFSNSSGREGEQSFSFYCKTILRLAVNSCFYNQCFLIRGVDRSQTRRSRGAVRGVSKMHYRAGDSTATHRRPPPTRHVLPHPPPPSPPRRRYRGRTVVFSDDRSARRKLSPLTSYFQSPTPSSYRQPTRSLRCPRDLFDPEGNFVREQNRGRERKRGGNICYRILGGVSFLRGERERGEHTGCMFQGRGICGRSTLYSVYNVDFTCKSERITKATQRLYLI